MALTNWSPELIKFYNKQIIDRDSLYNKYRSEKYGKRWAKAFKNLSSVEKGNIKKLYLNWQKILPNIKKIEAGNLIRLDEASEILKLPKSTATKGLTTRLYDALSRQGSRGPQGRNFIDNVLRPTFKLEKIKIGEAVPSWFIKDPRTVKDGVKILNDYYQRSGSKYGITSDVLERVKDLHGKNKNIVKTFVKGDLNKTLDLINDRGWTGSQGSTAMFRLGQLYNGHKFANVDFKLPKNKKLASSIFESIDKAPYTNVFHSRGYQLALATITENLADDYWKKGSMESFKKDIRRVLNKNGIPGTKWQINELIGVTPTTRTGAYPYSQFVNLMEKKFNTGQYADYVKQLGKYQIELQGAKDPSSVISKYDTYAKNFRELHGLKKTQLPTLSTQHPSKLYSAKRLDQLKAQGLDLPEHFKKAKYSIGVGEKTPTLGEVRTAFRESPELIKKINKSPLKKIIELRVGCADGCLAQVAKNEPGKITKALNTLPDKTKGFLGLLGRGGMKAAPLAAVAAAGAIAEPLVKQFRNDDPTTYLSNPDQQKGMLLSMLESETPQVDEEILKWQYPGQIAGAAAAIPGSSAVMKARKARKFGTARAALGPAGKVLAGSFSPLAVAASLPIGIAAQVKGGSDFEDIATDPFNWIGPAFASSGARIATRGMNPTGILAKAIRMGMSPGALRVVSRLGAPGLALTAGLKGYDLYKNWGQE
tara:strand:+ start:4317 stop:6434 length:2118 start_codon:yes stop_codon:yes gene_type:complete